VRTFSSLPWDRIAIALGIAAIIAWTLGFLAGIVVRWQFGI
jgi:hypothetical protein